jgi:hypothetical protein
MSFCRACLAGTYYTNFASLCNERASLISDVCSVLLRSGVLYSLSNSNFSNTAFMPGNKALAQAGVTKAQILQAGWSTCNGNRLTMKPPLYLPLLYFFKTLFSLQATAAAGDQYTLHEVRKLHFQHLLNAAFAWPCYHATNWPCTEL